MHGVVKCAAKVIIEADTVGAQAPLLCLAGGEL
jgi:hypothetical protein